MMSQVESDEEPAVVQHATRKRVLRLDSDPSPIEGTLELPTLDSSSCHGQPRTRRRTSARVTNSSDSSGESSEGSSQKKAKTSTESSPASSNGRPMRKGRFVKGTTLMASLKVKPNGFKERTSPCTSTTDNSSKIRRSDDDTLGNILLSIPDVGICSLSEEVARVKGVSSKSSSSHVKQKRSMRSTISYRPTKVSDDDSDHMMSPEIALQNNEASDIPSSSTRKKSITDWEGKTDIQWRHVSTEECLDISKSSQVQDTSNVTEISTNSETTSPESTTTTTLLNQIISSTESPTDESNTYSELKGLLRQTGRQLLATSPSHLPQQQLNIEEVSVIDTCVSMSQPTFFHPEEINFSSSAFSLPLSHTASSVLDTYNSPYFLSAPMCSGSSFVNELNTAQVLNQQTNDATTATGGNYSHHLSSTRPPTQTADFRNAPAANTIPSSNSLKDVLFLSNASKAVTSLASHANSFSPTSITSQSITSPTKSIPAKRHATNTKLVSSSCQTVVPVGTSKSSFSEHAASSVGSYSMVGLGLSGQAPPSATFNDVSKSSNAKRKSSSASESKGKKSRSHSAATSETTSRSSSKPRNKSELYRKVASDPRKHKNLLQVSPKWKETLQEKMRELFRRQENAPAEATSSPITPSLALSSTPLPFVVPPPVPLSSVTSPRLASTPPPSTDLLSAASFVNPLQVPLSPPSSARSHASSLSSAPPSATPLIVSSSSGTMPPATPPSVASPNSSGSNNSRMKFIKGCTNKLTRPPMKAKPPSILRNSWSPRQIPSPALNTELHHPIMSSQERLQAAGGMSPSSHPIMSSQERLQAAGGMSPSSQVGLPSPFSSMLSSGILDAINYAELERQYRSAQSMLESQQQHVDKLKSRLMQARIQQQIILLNSDHYQRCCKTLTPPVTPLDLNDLPVTMPGYKTKLEGSLSPDKWKGSFEKPFLDCLDFYTGKVEPIS